MSVMFLGFRSTNSSFQRPILLLLNNSRLHCSSSQTSPNLIEDFLPWLQRKSGVEISSTLSIGNSIYGRSLFASKAIREGDCIMQVPFSVKLTPYNLPPEIESLLGDDVGNVARLAVVVLVEQKLGQDSQWTLYINSLPRHGELHSTVFWSNEEMEMVRLSSLYMETVNQKVQIEKEFLMIRPVFDRFPQYFEDITWKDFLHAYALVGSRAWGNIEGLSLVPFADFLNHDGVCEAVLLSDNHRRLSEVIADRNYAPGEQVLQRRPSASEIALHVIGNGDKTVVWNDPWHPLEYHTRLLGEIASMLPCVEISNGQEDEIVWTVSNNDGSVVDNKGAWGAILRENLSDPIGATAGSFPSASIPVMELKVVEMGIVLAGKHNRKRVIIVTYSTIALLYLTGKLNPTWDTKNLVHRIRAMMGKLEAWEIRFNYRETNEAADFLAGLHPGVDWVEFLPSSFAQDLKDIIHREKGHVLIRYGKFSNSTLLLDFGFTLPYNIYDQVSLY
ncbi:hypothetical protein GIB67_038226 [Kingdonia uniflora]|uniref:RNase H type-1 domain-containing protein n=1 Tax=Kingdonia uniflora TaxID=39325 RepID=A0A7J7NGX5_9MAGN|nr:hypothetical protein GIB67_038226 [Kingdonia uniflora]